MPVQTLNYATPGPSKSRHDKTYTYALFALTAYNALGILCLTFPFGPPTGCPSETAHILTGFLAFYFVAGAVVLRVRLKAPGARKWPTVALNLLLLVHVPFGAAVGLYGLLNADKTAP